MTTLFLDYDGALHPNEVYQRPGRGIVLEMEGHTLFEHAEALAELLEPHPGVRIVLSTSWVWTLDFKRAKARLPDALQARVKGATWHSSMDREWWNALTRFEQIDTYVRRHGLTDWIAIDDNDIGWPDELRYRLIHCDEHGGIGDTQQREALIEWLQRKEKDYGND
jgi:hypothetical protein